MPVKIYYNDQIFRLAKLPATLEDLKKTISELYSGSLPSSWLLQYVDSDGDKVVLSHSDEYSELQDAERQGKAANVVTKLYINAINNNKLLEVEKTSYQAPEEVSKAPRKDSFEIVQTESVTDKKINYPVLPEINEIEVNKTSSEASSQKLNSSQYQVEQMAIAKESTFAQEATGHTNPSASKVEKVKKDKKDKNDKKDKKDKEALKESKKNVRETIKLGKQLEKGKLTPEEAAKASERLSELELILTPEEKKILEDKKQKHILRMEKREAKREEKPTKEKEPKVIQEKKREKKSSSFKAFKTFQKISFLFAKGKTEKIEKCAGKLVKMIPESSVEQFNAAMNNVLALIKAQNTTSDMLQTELRKTEQVFLEISGPAEEKQKRVDEWTEAEKLWKEKMTKNIQKKEERLAKKAERIANKEEKINKPEKAQNQEEKAKAKEEKIRMKEEKSKNKEEKIKNKKEKFPKKEKKEKIQPAQMLNN